MKRFVLVTLCMLIASAAVTPVVQADTHATTLVITTSGLPPGCASAVHVSAAALPGQPASEASIQGCRAIVFTKPALADVQVAILGGEDGAKNTYFCDWRPLEPASCSGVWVYQGPGTTVQLVIRSGAPGAVTATGA